MTILKSIFSTSIYNIVSINNECIIQKGSYVCPICNVIIVYEVVIPIIEYKYLKSNGINRPIEI